MCQEGERQFLEIKVANCIKGIAAVSIMLGHYLSSFNPLFSIPFAGNLWVAIFFFYSGYGLTFSKNNKKGYLNNFMSKKAVSVYIPFVLAETAYSIVEILIGTVQFRRKQFLLSCIGLNLRNGVLWYVLELIVLYLLFYIDNKFLKNFNTKVFWYIIFCAFMICSVFKDIDTCWYISTFAFLMGLFFEDYSKYFKLLEKRKAIKIATIVLFMILYGIMKYFSVTKNSVLLFKSTYIIVLLDLILAPLFVVFVSIVCNIVPEKFLSTRPFEFLADYSYEIYLWHMLPVLIVGKYFNGFISILLSVIATFVISYFSSICNKHLKIFI